MFCYNLIKLLTLLLPSSLLSFLFFFFSFQNERHFGKDFFFFFPPYAIREKKGETISMPPNERDIRFLFCCFSLFLSVLQTEKCFDNKYPVRRQTKSNISFVCVYLTKISGKSNESVSDLFFCFVLTSLFFSFVSFSFWLATDPAECRRHAVVEHQPGHSGQHRVRNCEM